MIRLLIGNSISKIEGLDQAQFKSLREVLSYKIPPEQMYHSGNFRNPKRYLLTKRCEFPSGLLYLVEGWLMSAQSKSWWAQDLRKQPSEGEKLKLEGKFDFAPYPEQLDASCAALNKQRGIIVAPTGVGKSVIAACIIQGLQYRTLIVVPSLELKKQLTLTLTGIFGKENVGELGANIAIENVDALDTDTKLVGYPCIIVDEIHHAAAATYRKLNQKCWGGVYFRFGLTATPFRTQDHERLLFESFLSKVIYQITYETAVQKGYVVPVEAFYADLPLTPTEGHTWAEVYKDLCTNNHYRNGLIGGYLSALSDQGLAALCLIKEVAHGEALSHIAKVPFANGKDEWTRMYILDFALGSLKTLIGTTGVLGEGVDTKPAEYIIIAGLGKSKTQFMQAVGRGMRKYAGKQSCKVIIFRDVSHKFTLAHFKAQCKILRDEYGIKPVRLG